MTLKLAVATDAVRVFVKPGGAKPSLIPGVTIEVHPRNDKIVTVEMSRGQARVLINELDAAIAAGNPPEKT